VTTLLSTFLRRTRPRGYQVMGAYACL
jgi:hypothetical protein